MIRLFKLIILQLVLLFSTLLMSSCAPQEKPPVVNSVPIAGYLALQEEFGDRDFSALKHRRIVLDPGHGGFFRGALGPSGLTEAEVNLGVALYLRGLLEWAGAEVYLTRTADYDFLTQADSTLASDLAFRSSFTDSLQPDVFLSIHHNSTASADPDINETQTYYPLGDDGASLDLARSIHRHLVLNLEITPAKILPGNFHVLRNATVPAVLGEPAMISNPVIEGRLSLASSLDLEAKAYFLGLLDYFSAGQPHWSGVDTLLAGPGIPEITLTQFFLTAEPGQPEGPAPDPSSFQLTLNGQRQGFDLSPDGSRISWSSTGPFPPGTSLLRLTGRNLKGRATPVAKTVIVNQSHSRISVSYSSESSDDNPSPRTMIFWKTQPGATSGGDFLLVNGQYNLLLPAGDSGWFLLPDSAGRNPVFEFRERGSELKRPVATTLGPNLPAPYRWRLVTLGESPTFASSNIPPGGWRHRLAPSDIGSGHSMLAGGSPAFIRGPGSAIWIEAKGLLPLINPGKNRTDLKSTFSGQTEVIRPRLLLHQLFGKTIVLDPAGGGTNNNGTYPLGTRGADLNLKTAQQLRLLLEGAGANVLMTRQAEVAPDPQQKVLLAGKNKADLFLTISRTMPDQQPRIEHHPGSRIGQRWAGAMAKALAPMDSLSVGTSYAYLLRHTACPALNLRLQAPENAQDEMLVSSLAWQMAESRAALLACATALSGGDQLPASVNPAQLIGQLASAQPQRSLPNVQLARWDGNFQWVPPTFPNRQNSLVSWQATGWPAVSKLHTLEIHSGPMWQIWRVTLPAETHLLPQFELIMENR